jgi:hypothetical protein
MNDDLPKKLNRILKYGADHSTVENLLSQLASPEHLHTRLGPDHEQSDPERSDHIRRAVTADALQEHNRNSEADLLRDRGQHVMVQGGKVIPARLTHVGVPPVETYLPPEPDDEDVTLYRYHPSTEYMIGSHWGGNPAWCSSDDFEVYPTLDELRSNHPNAKPFDEAFPGEQFDEVQHHLTPEELREEPDPDHPHNRGKR